MGDASSSLLRTPGPPLLTPIGSLSLPPSSVAGKLEDEGDRGQDGVGVGQYWSF